MGGNFRFQADLTKTPRGIVRRFRAPPDHRRTRMPRLQRLPKDWGRAHSKALSHRKGENYAISSGNRRTKFARKRLAGARSSAVSGAAESSDGPRLTIRRG